MLVRVTCETQVCLLRDFFLYSCDYLMYSRRRAMLKPKHLDELSRRVLEHLPDGLSAAHDDMRQNFRAAVGAAVQRMDLVTREEFDVQAGVLRRTREKLEALEARVAALEGTVAQND